MKKGYTLIELLATIAVLAIVSLIAFPKITDAIEKAKLNSAKASALGYIRAVEIAYVGNNLSSTDAYLTPDIDHAPLDKKYTVKVRGRKPSKGWISVDNDRIDEYSLQIGKYVVDFDSNNITVTKGNVTREKPEKNVYILLDKRMLSNSNENSYLNYEINKGLKITSGSRYSYCLKIDYTSNGERVLQDSCDGQGIGEIFSSQQQCQSYVDELLSSLENAPAGSITPLDVSLSCYSKDNYKKPDNLVNNIYIKTKTDKDGRAYNIKLCFNTDSSGEFCISDNEDLEDIKERLIPYSGYDESTWNEPINYLGTSVSLAKQSIPNILIGTDPTKKKILAIASHNDEKSYEFLNNNSTIDKLNIIYFVAGIHNNITDIAINKFEDNIAYSCNISRSNNKNSTVNCRMGYMSNDDIESIKEMFESE